MGNKRKQMRSQYEVECIDRRRSTRIIALEGKKQQERERNIALTLEKKNKSINQDIRNKGKGKAIINVWDDLSDFNEDEEGLTESGCKSKELYHIISSIKSIQGSGRDSQNASTSGTNVADISLNGIPLKNILTIIIDFLQRKDTYELFAQPINSDVVENYNKIVKQPMDFGTMRAKLHEGMYTDLELFKRDIFLMCSNAMNSNIKTSQYYEVAEDISNYAKHIFKVLSVEVEFNLEDSLNKRCSSKEQQKEHMRTSRKVASKHSGRKNYTKIEKRNMYWPPSKPRVAGVLYANNRNIQVNENPNKYKESLMRFAKDLGPIAQKVASKKLEFTDQQLCINETSTQNPLQHVLGNQIIHHPTQQTPKQPSTLITQTLPLTLPFPNKPLTIHGSVDQQNRIVDNTKASNVNFMNNGPYQGKNWHACAAALLSNLFFTNENGGSSNGIECSNAIGNMNLKGFSKGKMVSHMENTSHLHFGVNNSSNTGQWNTSTNVPIMSATGSSSSTFSIVHPTVVISGPQPMQKCSMYDMPNNYLTGMHKSAPYIPSAPQGFLDMQMQASHQKSHEDEPVPLQASSSSSSLEMAFESAINYCGEEDAPLGLTKEVPAQLRLDNGQQPNLDLGL